MNMTRNVMVLLFCSGVLFITLMAGAGTPTSVVNSKHNLSGATTNAYRAASSPASGGTNEVCIFCHTPHAGNSEAPLWNRAAYDRPSGYTPYSSDVLTGLSYSSAEDPYNTGLAAAAVHAKTRVCLSCHDGTIALGSLVNMPSNISGYSEIQMAGDKYIQTSAQGFIGVDLSDDHPVSIAYVSGVDPELRPSLDDSLATNVKLYQLNGGKVKTTRTSATNAYVECTSCHNPHDNQYGNFLVDSNQGSKICRTCHIKNIGLSTNSAHDNASIGYNYDGVSSTETVGTLKCMTCHFPHKAGGTGTYPNIAPISAGSTLGKYLLSFPEEMSCYNNYNNDAKNRWGQNTTVCHGNNGAVSNIQDLVRGAKASEHQVDKYPSKHEATEVNIYGWLTPGNAKWHIECADCHNPHTAGSTKHVDNPPTPIFLPALKELVSSSPLYGAGGVRVISEPTWGGSSGTYATDLEPVGVVDKSKTATGAKYEYQICLKCHSDFAWGTGIAPTSPSLGAAYTNQAKEFMNSVSYHPVTKVTGRTVGTLVSSPDWRTHIGDQTMYCSDCHNNNALLQPQGPHGSGNNFILVAPFNDTPSVANGGVEQGAGDLCFVCHDLTTYGIPSTTATGGTGFKMAATNYNLHARHASLVSTTPGAWGYKCVDCHARVPHGWQQPAMIVTTADPAPYNNGARISSPFTPNQNNYIKTSCATVAGCHL